MNAQDAREKLIDAIDYWGNDPRTKTRCNVTEAIDNLQAACQEPPSALTEKIAAMESLPWSDYQKDNLKAILRQMIGAVKGIAKGIEFCKYRDAATDAVLDVAIENLHEYIKAGLLSLNEKWGK